MRYINLQKAGDSTSSFSISTIIIIIQSNSDLISPKYGFDRESRLFVRGVSIRGVAWRGVAWRSWRGVVQWLSGLETLYFHFTKTMTTRRSGTGQQEQEDTYELDYV